VVEDRRLAPVTVQRRVLGWVAVGAVALAAAGSQLPHQPIPGNGPEQILRGAGIAIALLLGVAPLLRRRWGRSGETLTFGATATTIALVTVPWPWAAFLQLLATLVAGLVARRPAVKTAFNTANDVVLVTLAGLIAGAGSDTGHHVGTARGALSLLAGVALASIVSELALNAVVAASQDVPFLGVATDGLRVRVAQLVLNAALGLAVVVVAHASPLTLATLPVVAALLVLLHRGNQRADRERDVWRQLEAAGRELKTLDENLILDRALARSAALLRCDSVELLLARHGEPGEVQRCRGGLRGLRERVDEVGWVPTVTADRPRPTTDGVGGVVVEVGLTGPAGALGVLRVDLPGEGHVEERELQALATYARGLSSTLLNARLYADAVAEAELKAWQAGHDPLTGLVNRQGLLEVAPTVEAEVHGSGETMAVLVLDLDHFKQVNDVLGHDSGDRLLQHLAEVLTERVRPVDLAVRLEGDTFALLLRGLRGDEAVERIAHDVLRVVAEPVEHEGLRLSLEASLGYALSPTDGDTIAQLLTRASAAMTLAKRSPGSTRRWRAERAEHSRARLALSADLRTGLEAGGELLLHFQPQVDLATGGISTVEALARWQHPTRGLLTPDEFVPIAEHSGLARPFTLAVLEAAVAEAALWREMGLGGPRRGLGRISVAVNLSARNLLDRELPADLAVVLARHGLPARQLVLEITETVALAELEVVNDVLARLRSLGVQLSVDDFGTGYSSLRFLQAIAVNELKIDKEFVSGMLASESDAAIVRASLELGHGLGLRVVAEGVEQQEQLDALRELGCDAVQGFHIARPLPAEVLREVLADRSGRVVSLASRRRRA